MLQTSKLVVERAKELVAELLEAAPEDIVVIGDGRLGVAGVPSRALDWAAVARTAPERGEPLLVQHDTDQSAVDLSIRQPTSPSSRSTSRPDVWCPIAALCGRRLRRHRQPASRRRSGARRAGVGDRAGAVGAVPLRRGRQPDHDHPGRVRHPERGRAAVVHHRAHRDAVANERSRGQGDRRVRHGRVNACRAERRGRCPQSPWRSAHRHALHAGAGLAGHSGRAGRERWPIPGATRQPKWRHFPRKAPRARNSSVEPKV